jgi:hypothetical protein
MRKIKCHPRMFLSGIRLIPAFAGMTILLLLVSSAFAEEKSWSAQGDGKTWTDDANWVPLGVPTVSDDVTVNMTDASANISEAANFRSLTLAGKKESAVTISNFTNVDIAPGNATDNAIYNRRDGNLIIKGSVGTINLKGAYKDSEEIIADEPSFMLYVK